MMPPKTIETNLINQLLNYVVRQLAHRYTLPTTTLTVITNYMYLIGRTFAPLETRFPFKIPLNLYAFVEHRHFRNTASISWCLTLRTTDQISSKSRKEERRFFANDVIRGLINP